jgi:hypothetical protein
MPDHVMNYIECELPTGLALAAWRRSRAERKQPRRRFRPAFAF